MNRSAETREAVPGDLSPGRAFADPPLRVGSVSEPAAPTVHRFRLYVAGDAQNAALALANLTAFCHAYLADRHTIEIVDVFEDPRRALAEQIYMTPTLVVFAPGPARRIVGTLEDHRALQRILGVVTEGS